MYVRPCSIHASHLLNQTQILQKYYFFLNGIPRFLHTPGSTTAAPSSSSSPPPTSWSPHRLQLSILGHSLGARQQQQGTLAGPSSPKATKGAAGQGGGDSTPAPPPPPGVLQQLQQAAGALPSCPLGEMLKKYEETQGQCGEAMQPLVLQLRWTPDGMATTDRVGWMVLSLRGVSL